MRRAISESVRAGGQVGMREHDRLADVAALRHRTVDGHLTDKRRARERGEAPAAAGAEDGVARAVGRDELVHVLHDAEHFEVRTPGHVGDACGDFLRALGGRGDHQHLGLGQEPGERHLDVARARGHVDEQVVEVAPTNVHEELLERLREDQAPPHERGVFVVDEQAHADHAQAPATGHFHFLRNDLAGAVGQLRARQARLHTEHPRDRKAPDVGVEHTDGETACRQGGGDVRGDRRLADPTLSAADGDHPGGRRDLRAGAPAATRARRARCITVERSSWFISAYSTVTSLTPGTPATFDCTSFAIWPRSGQAAVVSATRTVTFPAGSTLMSSHHPEVDDRGVELGVEHTREHAADVLRAGRGGDEVGHVDCISSVMSGRP